MDLKDVRLEHFAALVGETFRIELDEATAVGLELAEATKAAGDRSDSAFSVVFKGPRERRLEQRIYDVQHAGLGTLSIFLVPIAERPDGYLYEAIFTRLEEEPTP
jgi:hypothetical protein